MFFVVNFKNGVVLHGISSNDDAFHEVLHTLYSGFKCEVSIFDSIEDYLDIVFG